METPALYAEIDRLKADLAMSQQIIAEMLARDTDINEIKKQAFVAGALNYRSIIYNTKIPKLAQAIINEKAEEYANGPK